MSALGDIAATIAAGASRKAVPEDGTRAHRVTVAIGNEQIDGLIDYDILNSMVEPADGFRISMPFDKDAWNLCRLDEEVRVCVDGTIVLDGYIDDRTRATKDGTIEIAGRDKSGRLVQESIPNVNGWDGLLLTDAIKKLAEPWFTSASLSDARNRSVRRGKGHRASAGGEPAFFKVKGKLDEEHAGRLDPGEMRWNVIQQLASSVSLGVWSSADGREIIIGEPNYEQAIQYLLRHSVTRGSTVKDMKLKESVADGYALIEVHGMGSGSDADFGSNVTAYLGIAKDGPNADGTGGDFLRPKRLAMAQRSFESNAEAQRAAEREMKKRKFNRRQLTATSALHGQLVAGTVMTLFAPNTLARVIDDELETDETWLIYACRLRGSRGGEETDLMLVPRGTAFVTA